MANRIGKCFLVNGQLLKITDKYSTTPIYENYYMHESIIPIAKSHGIGYRLSSGVYYLGEDVKQVDLTVWDKTLKLINLGNVTCTNILANAKTFPTHTGFTKLVYTHPNIVKVIGLNRSLFITPEQFSVLYVREIDRYIFSRNQVICNTSTENISEDIYKKVYNNIKDTTNNIKDLWT